MAPRLRLALAPTVGLICLALGGQAVADSHPAGFTSPRAATLSSAYRHCRAPSYDPFGNTLTDRGTSCRTARRVISAYFALAQAQGPSVRVHRFNCIDDASGAEPVVRCRRGHARINYRGPQG